MKGMIKCPRCNFSEDIEKFDWILEECEIVYICPACNNKFDLDPCQRTTQMAQCECCGRHIPKPASHWRGQYILCFTCVVPFDIAYKENNNHSIEVRNE